MVLVEFCIRWAYRLSLILLSWIKDSVRLWVMSDVRSQDGSNRETLKVSSCYVPSLDDITVYIRRVRESTPLLFLAIVGSIFAEDWTRVTLQNFKVLSIPKSLKVEIACMFLRGEPTVWIERVAQPPMYRWNEFRSSLERNFGSFGVDWKSRMVKEFGNSTHDSSEGGLGWCESTGPSNTLGRDAGVMAVTVMARKIPRRILRERLNGLKPREGYSP